MLSCALVFFFFFNDTATTEIYTLSLHDALPISFSESRRRKIQRRGRPSWRRVRISQGRSRPRLRRFRSRDRKSTRLNSSHLVISYAVFCLKKKNSLLSHYARCHVTTIHLD